MTYATLQHLTDRYGERDLIDLTDRAEDPTGQIDADVIDRALADADAQIDGYLARRYVLPLAQTPPLVVDLAQVITFWKLHRYDPPTKVKDDYVAAERSLRDISRGDIKLDVAGSEPEGNDADGVQVTDRDRPLEASKMSGFI